MKKIIVVISLLVICGIIITYYILTPAVTYDENIFGDVTGSVTIQRDKHGLPGITVDTLNDFYFALGFVHAQDRYELMDYYRVLAKGEADRRLGKEKAVWNRLSKTCGFLKHARKIEQSMDEKEISYLQAYAGGINKAIEADYIASQYTWQPVDVLAVLLMREWANAFLNNKEFIFPVDRDYKTIDIHKLFPRSLVYYYDEDDIEGKSVIFNIRALVARYVGTFNRGSALYIPGRATKQRKPVLAYSFEDSGSVYPGWMPAIAYINKKKYKIITHVGLPFIFSSSNDVFSFTSFNLNIDIQDFYAIEIREQNELTQYQTRFGWKELLPEPQPAPVPDSGQTQLPVKVISTDYGIVLNPVFDNESARDTIVVLQYDFPGTEYVSALFSIPFSENSAKARKELRGLAAYPRLYMFMDKKRAYQAFAGKIPARSQQNSLFKRYFNSPWKNGRDISFYSYPVYSKKVSGSSFFHFVPGLIAKYAVHDEYRYKHIDSLLTKTKLFSDKGIRRMMLDVKSPVAEIFTPYFLSILKHNLLTSSSLTKIYFHNWNFKMTAQSVPSTIFAFLLEQFVIETYKDNFPRDIETIKENYYYLLPQFQSLVQKNISSVFDDKGTDDIENRDTIFDRAFLISIRQLSRKAGPIMDKWKLGQVYGSRFRVFKTHKNFISDLFASEENVPFKGGNDTLFKGPVSEKQQVKYVTMVSGYFTENWSGIFQNYAQSINQTSDFNYETIKQIRFKRFEKIRSKYSMKLMPMTPTNPPADDNKQ